VKRRSVLWLLFVVALVAAGGLGVSSGRAAGTAGVASGGAPLRKVAEFELPGPPGKRFDYLTIDEDDNYLLSAHLAAGLLHVIDLKTNAVVKTVRDVPGVEGVAYIAEGKKVYTANWGENKIGVIVDGCRGNHGMAIGAERRRAFLSCETNDTLTVFDLESHKAIAHLPMAKGADVVMFDPGLGRIYVACGSGAISVFQMDDPTNFRKLKDVPVEPKIHSLAVDPKTHRVYAPAEQEKGRPASKMFVFEAVND
jgi:DNA-binding beta-propeller fold protein YncE